ncbi:protein of unknown function [Azospirillum lipoferum 4B]|uniref:Type II toxin-antitoxin system RelE/ParE family toxin n=1 Tax=Azospirillum lipoferum (strain 4B) TaxID=862719 RepID=G7Z2R6_AZOL4|nr:protein of unknown function [Azospirillum lipoferum 4B]
MRRTHRREVKMPTPAKPSINRQFDIRFLPGDEQDGSGRELLNLLKSLSRFERVDVSSRVEALFLNLSAKGPYGDPYMEKDETRYYKYYYQGIIIFYSVFENVITVLHSRRVRCSSEEREGQRIVDRRLMGIYLVK